MIPQIKGREQGDPLMPLLFCLSLHRALVAANARLHDGESLFAFLDDVGNFKDVQFLPHAEFWPFWGPSLVTLLTFKNVKNPKHPEHLKT